MMLVAINYIQGKYRAVCIGQLQSLDSKEEKHGATVHVVTPDLDSGPIVAQAEIQIDPMDDAESLGAKVLEREHLLYASAIKSIIQGDFILPEKMEAWAKNGI